MTRHLLVIGAQRSGTTYLYRLLDEHPDVVMAQPARPEPKVFLDPDRSSRGIDWYVETYFGGRSGAVLGEKSTSYLESPEAAQRALAMLGAATIFVALRDPVERAISNWRFSSASGLETRPLETALRENLQAPAEWDATKTSVSPFAYLERGRYMDYLPPWTDAFGDDVHVFFTDEITAIDGAAAVYAAAGVDTAVRPAVTGTRVNAAEHPVEELDADLLRSVRSYFDDSDKQLSEFLDRPLPWRAEWDAADAG